MKTTIIAFALLFATISFTACTHQSIEPIRPATQPSSFVRTDSIETVHMLSEKAELPVYNGFETVEQEFDRKPYQQPHIVMPSPQPMPRESVMPVMKLDTLTQY